MSMFQILNAKFGAKCNLFSFKLRPVTIVNCLHFFSGFDAFLFFIIFGFIYFCFFITLLQDVNNDVSKHGRHDYIIIFAPCCTSWIIKVKME